MRVLVEIEIEEHVTRRLLQQNDPLSALQRRTLQLPGHVYLVSFVLLVIIIGLLLTCHCIRMCRIAYRLRVATAAHPELVEVLAGGPNSSRKTPQEVIDRLPVAKYSAVHAEWLAKHQGAPASAPAPTCTTAAAAGGGGSVHDPSDGLQRHGSAPLQQQQQPSPTGLRSWFTWRSSPGVATPTDTLATAPLPPPLTTVSVAAGTTSSAAGPEGGRPGAARPGHARTMSVDGYLALLQQQQQQQQQQLLEGEQGELEQPHPHKGLVSAAIELRGTSSADKACRHQLECSSSSSEGCGSHTIGAAANGPPPGGSSSGSSSSDSDALPCTICLEEFEDSDDVKQLPCGHFYHCRCIEAWLERDITCPLCKAPVVSQDLLEQRAAAAAAALAALQATSVSGRRLTSRELAGLAGEVMGLQAALDRALGPWRRREAARRQQQQQQQGGSSGAAAGDMEMPPAPSAAAVTTGR